MSQNLTPIPTPVVPHARLDQLLVNGGLKNDAALARLLEVAPPVISKIRHRTLPVGATLQIRIHKACDLAIRDIEALIESPIQLVSPRELDVDAACRPAAARRAGAGRQ